MKDVEPLGAPAYKHLYLFFYLIPIFGFFPALWTLCRRQGSREQLTVSRLSVTLFLTLRLLLLNTLLTSGYFMVSLWLMVGLNERQSPRLPGFSHFAERLLGKHLS